MRLSGPFVAALPAGMAIFVVGPVSAATSLASSSQGAPLAILLGAIAVAFVGLILYGRVSASSARLPAPAWVREAKSRLPDGVSSRVHLNTLREIEQKLVPDIAERGRVALARAHQLDLFARYLTRANLPDGGEIRGAQLREWRSISNATLKAVAPGIAQRASILRDVRENLAALQAEDADRISAFYRMQAERVHTETDAWRRAKAALAAIPADQKSVNEAFEELRTLNRETAASAAELVGDIEISVRAVV